MEDKKLVCKDCGETFVWTAGEQEFYQQKGLTNEPKRCVACRRAKKAAQQQTAPVEAVATEEVKSEE